VPDRAIDVRLKSLLQREFVTIKLAREPAFFERMRVVKDDFARRNVLGSTLFVFAVSQVCADMYETLAASYLERLLKRVDELGEPWTVDLCADSIALLSGQLTNDWNWIVGMRDKTAGERLRDQTTGQITHAQNISIRLIEEELEARVLRQDRRRLPLPELLRPTRYEFVLSHLLSAYAAAAAPTPSGQDVAREAIHAVEALARLVTHEPTKTLGDCLRILMARSDDAGRQLLGSVEKIWAFCNVAPSVRHGGGTGDTVTAPESQYTLGVAEAALRFLLVQDRA
jgi:hypothetical protein